MNFLFWILFVGMLHVYYQRALLRNIVINFNTLRVVVQLF